MEILRVNKLTVGYGEKIVASDMDFQINKGEIVAVIGKNGSGKSTLLKTVAGINEPLGGDMFLLSKCFSQYSVAERARVIASLFTEKIYADLMSCYEMVAMGRFPYTNTFGSLSRDDISIIEDVAEMTGTKDLMQQDFEKISDGQKQRVLLARAICQKPELLILDEPTSFLDIKYKLELLTMLKNLAEEMGFSVFLSIHELDMAKQIADRIICLKDGKIDRIGTSDEIFSDGYISELFDIRTGSFDENTGLGII